MDWILVYDAAEKGINSVLTINPKAMDAMANKGQGMMGIPVLIKDNVNTSQMVTSGGTYALNDFVPAKNAPLVDCLIANKAIILGKANLSELANFMSTKMPSGYSSKGGQTHNPFDPIVLTPSGYSSGSGAAVAINFATVAIGTETTSSIISPALAQSVLCYKPSLNRISDQGVPPLSSTMDTVGTMAKNVKDAVALYNGSVESGKEIKENGDKNYLSGKRIGLQGEDADGQLQKALEAAGAPSSRWSFRSQV